MATQVAYPTGINVAFRPGVGMHDISLLAAGAGWSAASITAHAGGTRALATPVSGAVTLIAVSASAGDSVMLPPATGGQVLWITNAGAASSQLFANTAGSDTINGIAAATGIALAAGKSITLLSPIPGAWFGVLSA
jgi:hypothetical protein